MPLRLLRRAPRVLKLVFPEIFTCVPGPTIRSRRTATPPPNSSVGDWPARKQPFATGGDGSVSAGWRRQRLIILADFRVEYAQAVAVSRCGLVQAFAHFLVPTSVRQVRSAAAQTRRLTPSNGNSRLHPKERRNSPHSGTHLRQTGGFFVPMCLVGATDAKPASGGRLIQHPQGE
jgi:hypothetical protein